MNRAETGRRGEAAAARWYQKQGAQLLAHNYHTRMGELDLVLREPDGTFRCIVEARDCTPEQASVTEVNTGTYVFHVPALLRVLDLLNNNNAQGELYLTDVPALLKAQGLRVGLCDTCAPDEMLGVNTVEQLRQVELLLRAQG